MARTDSGSSTRDSISSRTLIPGAPWLGALNVRTAAPAAWRRRSNLPPARRLCLSSSKRTLSSKWRGRTRLAPRRRRASRADPASAARSLISLSTWALRRAAPSSVHDADLDVDPLLGIVPCVAARGHDLVRDLDAAHHAPEGRVLPVEEARVGHADEELRTGA